MFKGKEVRCTESLYDKIKNKKQKRKVCDVGVIKKVSGVYSTSHCTMLKVRTISSYFPKQWVLVCTFKISLSPFKSIVNKTKYIRGS